MLRSRARRGDVPLAQRLLRLRDEHGRLASGRRRPPRLGRAIPRLAVRPRLGAGVSEHYEPGALQPEQRLGDVEVRASQRRGHRPHVPLSVDQG